MSKLIGVIGVFILFIPFFQFFISVRFGFIGFVLSWIVPIWFFAHFCK